MFSVEVDLVAEMAVFNPFDFFLDPSAETTPFAYEPKLAVELAPYLRQDAPTPAFTAFFESLDLKPRPTIDFLVALNLRVNQAVRYIIRLEAGVQSPEETLSRGSGSCRDSAWLLVQILRRLGLAARFVSGYLIQLRADVQALDGPKGAAKDFTDLHAWCEVYLPGAGWIGLDPTSGLLAGEGHLPLACSPEPSSAAPISGAVERCETKFEFEMTVRRIHETPRVTLPYADDTWAQINALGEKIDHLLAAGDVRLTMGGEPTFVAVDDMDGPEWNTAALGPRKRELAGQLFQRLSAHYGRGGFVHYGAGQVVSRRAAAALGPRLLLAARRGPAVAGAAAAGRSAGAGEPRGRRRPAFRRRARPAPRRRRRAARPRLRGRLLPCLEGAPHPSRGRGEGRQPERPPRAGAARPASSRRAWSRSSAMRCPCCATGPAAGFPLPGISWPGACS